MLIAWLFVLFNERVTAWRLLSGFEALEYDARLEVAVLAPFLPGGVHLPKHGEYLNEVRAPLEAERMVLRDGLISAVLLVDLRED